MKLTGKLERRFVPMPDEHYPVFRAALRALTALVADELQAYVDGTRNSEAETEGEETEGENQETPEVEPADSED
jgi:hypothetical protein